MENNKVTTLESVAKSIEDLAAMVARGFEQTTASVKSELAALEYRLGKRIDNLSDIVAEHDKSLITLTKKSKDRIGH